MSIVTIPNQPVAFNYPYDDCNSCDPREYSMPIFEDDDLCFQIKQTPCGPNLICDPTFEELSATLVTNGSFFGSAAGWTLGAGWAYAANAVTLTTNTGLLTQTIAITPLRRYIVRFVVSAVTGTPDLVVRLGGSSSIPAIVAAGSYTRVLIADNINSDIAFLDGTGTATYTLDTVEVYEITPCWSMDSSWDLSEEGYATHISGTTALSQTTPPLLNGRYYKVIFTVANYVSGSVRAKLGGTYGTAVSEDGEVTQYIYSSGTGFEFVPTTDFVGSITYVSIGLLKIDFTFQTLSICGDVEVRTATLSNKGTYFNEWVTFCFKPFVFVPRTLPCYDCFSIAIPDICTEYGRNFIRNGSFSLGWESWINGGNFNLGFRNLFAYAVAGGLLIQPYDGTDTEVIPYPDTHTQFWYEITVTGAVDAVSYVLLYVGGRLILTMTAPGTYTGTVTTLSMLSNSVRIAVAADATKTVIDLIYIDNVRMGYITEVDTEYISQPFRMIDADPTEDCTKVIKANCDENNFGFNFTDTDFFIQQRMQILKVNPVYVEERNDYLFSDGTRKITFGQSEKYWSIRTGFIPEHLHDTLRLQVLCDHLFMDDVEYYDKGGDYNPDYLGGNDYVVLSSVTREWRKKTENIFNNHCNNS